MPSASRSRVRVWFLSAPASADLVDPFEVAVAEAFQPVTDLRLKLEVIYISCASRVGFCKQGSVVRVPLAPQLRSKIRIPGPGVQQQSTATGTPGEMPHTRSSRGSPLGGGARIPGLGPGFRATGKEKRLWEAQSCLPGGQRAVCGVCRFKVGSCRSSRGSANGMGASGTP
jgi:hypothetical protein